MESSDSEDIALKQGLSLESLFCLLSKQADHCKKTGGGYRNASYSLSVRVDWKKGV